MNCAYCEVESKEIVKEHTVYELEWDQEGYPIFFEFKIGLCKDHQNNLENFSNRQKWMNLIQIIALFILSISAIGLGILRNYFGLGVVVFLFLGLLWYRIRPSQRILNSEEDCVAFGYQSVMASKIGDDEDETLFFSKREKEKIFKI